jgi:hypothetical protein
MRIALTDPAYAPLRHNCEHFACWVAFGVWESKQLQAAGWIAGLSMLVAAAFERDLGRRR